ncbi:MAG: 4'-phosphopantetheinyl transferase superfamily protein [Mogibacterium sp.]|nr:4'-phosphopantetheinyl transferase superfamily protein [Mogibacterium sp.]
MIIYYTDKFNGGREESHWLLEKALAVHTGDEQQAKILIGAMKEGEHGKPFIEGFSCFSISHTGNIWAVLIADQECGLDIQLCRKCDMKAIADRWFAPRDAARITELGRRDESGTGMESSDKENAVDTFFRIWTRREALTKALGGTVYDSGLPGVLSEYTVIDGKRYSFTDMVFPISKPIYTAVCVKGSKSAVLSGIIYLEGVYQKQN